MTVSTEVSLIAYDGNAGAPTVFSVPFPFIANSHIKAILTDKTVDPSVDTNLVENTDYTLTGAGEDTGQLTLVVGLATNYKLTIYREVPLTQLDNYEDQKAYYLTVLEKGQDKDTMALQQLQEQLDRSIKVPITSEEDFDPDGYLAQVEEARDDAETAAAAAATSETNAATSASEAAASAAIVVVGTVALTPGANISTDASLGTVFTVTLDQDSTLDNPTSKTVGKTYNWIITGAGYTLSYGTDFNFEGDSTINTNGVTVIEGVVVASDNIRCRIVNGLEKSVDFEAVNLKVDVASNTTVTITADKIKLINTDGSTLTRYNVNDTFDITTDIDAGTEYNSVAYGLWVSADNPTETITLKMTVDFESTADADVSNSLSDSAATFQTDGITAGDEIYQTTDTLKGYVKAVSSETVLTCMDDQGADLDLFPDGNETYIIKKLSPTNAKEFKARVASAENNASGNLDNMYYTQIQEEKFYSEAAGDFTVNTTNWTTDYAEIYVRQVNNWAGVGKWKANFNIEGGLSSGSTVVNAVVSGIVLDTNYTQQAVSISKSDAAATINLQRARSTNQISAASDQSETSWEFSGDVALDKKPTFHT